MVKNADGTNPTLRAAAREKGVPSLSTARLIAAQLLGVVGLVLSFFLAAALSPRINSLLDDIFGYSRLDSALTLFLFILVAGCTSFFEWLVLRRWTARVWWWILGSVVIFIAVMAAGGALIDRVSLALPFGFTRLDGALKAMVERELYKWNMIKGAIVGSPCGLVCGVFQSLMLNGGKRRWWLLNVITWMLVFIALGALSAYVAVFFAGMTL